MLPLENHHGRSRQRTSPGEKIDGALLCILRHPYPPLAGIREECYAPVSYLSLYQKI